MDKKQLRKELTNLEKEFLKVQEEAFEEDTQGYTSGEWQAKAAAALCERKMIRAIELARMFEGEWWAYTYTLDGIMQKLPEPPKDLTEKKTTTKP